MGTVVCGFVAEPTGAPPDTVAAETRFSKAG
jgi:hypothetical protein